MFLAFRERRFARRVVRRLLKSYSVIRDENPDLSGEPLYREVLLHAQLAEPSSVDQVLWQAEDSVDEWTTHADRVMGLRQVAHFIVMSQFRAAGYSGSVVSFKKIVYALVPADL
jgi:hypothetical protein